MHSQAGGITSNQYVILELLHQVFIYDPITINYRSCHKSSESGRGFPDTAREGTCGLQLWNSGGEISAVGVLEMQ